MRAACRRMEGQNDKIFIPNKKEFNFFIEFFLISVFLATKNAKGNKSGKSKSEYEGKFN